MTDSNKNQIGPVKAPQTTDSDGGARTIRPQGVCLSRKLETSAYLFPEKESGADDERLWVRLPELEAAISTAKQWASKYLREDDPWAEYAIFVGFEPSSDVELPLCYLLDADNNVVASGPATSGTPIKVRVRLVDVGDD
jgi:hypothetical protein